MTKSILAGLLLLLVASGCGDMDEYIRPADEYVCLERCASNETCIRGHCVQECATNEECESGCCRGTKDGGYYCVEGSITAKVCN